MVKTDKKQYLPNKKKNFKKPSAKASIIVDSGKPLMPYTQMLVNISTQEALLQGTGFTLNYLGLAGIHTCVCVCVFEFFCSDRA